MSTTPRLVLSQKHHTQLQNHLFPGDGFEAAAVMLCTKSSEHRFLVRQILLVPHTSCKFRGSDRISWPGDAIERAIDQAEVDSLSIILMHSHPGGFFGFSATDDESDRCVMPGLFEASKSLCIPHGSAVMVPSGAIRARFYDRELQISNCKIVMCPGDDIHLWRHSEEDGIGEVPMAFSTDMGLDLMGLTACVVGVSGTGSIVAEQLSRLGIGRLILIDFDLIELKNLNRILHSTLEDAANRVAKVDRFSSAIKAYRDNIKVTSIKSSIADRDAIAEVGQADVIFCCVDSFEGRQMCDRIAGAFLQPLFDVAVTIPTRQKEGENIAVGDVCGRVDYVKPGGSTLLDRQVYSPEALRKEYLKKVAPEEHDDQIAEGYIKGVIDEAPSVISLNMRAASDCVMEFIARTYPFRQEPNCLRARTLFSLAAGEEDHYRESDFERSHNPFLGRGLAEPLLGMACFDQEVASR